MTTTARRNLRAMNMDDVRALAREMASELAAQKTRPRKRKRVTERKPRPPVAKKPCLAAASPPDNSSPVVWAAVRAAASTLDKKPLSNRAIATFGDTVLAIYRLPRPRARADASWNDHAHKAPLVDALFVAETKEVVSRVLTMSTLGLREQKVIESALVSQLSQMPSTEVEKPETTGGYTEEQRVRAWNSFETHVRQALHGV